jgi:hypothetical protein
VALDGHRLRCAGGGGGPCHPTIVARRRLLRMSELAPEPTRPETSIVDGATLDSAGLS